MALLAALIFPRVIVLVIRRHVSGRRRYEAVFEGKLSKTTCDLLLYIFGSGNLACRSTEAEWWFRVGEMRRG